jgi:site-specific DNA-methyltransferase (adenine-specific)
MDAPRCHLDLQDATLWLDRMPSHCADLVVLDPGPPGRVTRGRGKGPSVPAFPAERMSTLLHEVNRVLKAGRVCWWVCESAHMLTAARMADKHGFAIGAPIVWDRVEGHPRLAFVLPLSRGRARSPGGELIVAPRVDGGLPGELPEALALALIEAATEPHEWVVDPFAGSGTFGVAAALAQRAYLGCDLSPEAHARAISRLEAAKAQPGASLEEAISAIAAGAPARPEAPASRRDGVGGASQLTMFGDAARLP